MEIFFCRDDRVAVATGESGKPAPLDLDPGELQSAIDYHVRGEARIGTYTPSPGDSLTPYLCFDLDGDEHDEEYALTDMDRTALEIAEQLEGEPYYMEVSGSGGGLHIWCFYDMAPAKVVRKFAYRILENVFEGSKIEVFPKSDFLPKGGTGNLVWLPYWGGADEGNCILMNSRGVPVAPEEIQRRSTPEVDMTTFEKLGIDFESNSRSVDPFAQELVQTDITWETPPFEELPKMLACIPNEGSWSRHYDDWFRILASAYHAYGPDAEDLLREWSAQNDKHDDDKFTKTWRSIATREGEGTVTVGTLLYFARRGGYVQRKPKTEAPSVRSGSHVELAHYMLAQIGEENIVHDRGSYWTYGNGAWERMSSDEMMRRIQDLDGQRFGLGVKEDGSPKVLELSLSSGDVRGIESMLRVACNVHEFFDESVPGVAFRNGFLGVDGLTRHDRHNRCRTYVNIDFKPDAPAPKFRNQMLGRYKETQRKYLQEKVGACLFGLAPSFAKATIFLGGGDDGKSQFLHVIRSLFSKDVVTSIAPHQMESEYNRADLSDSLLNVVSEVPASELHASEDFKAIISGEQIRGRVIRESPFDFRPQAGHIFAANSLPSTNDLTFGFFRRWAIIKSPGPVPKEDQIPDFWKVIVESELIGVYAWAFEGVQRLIENGGYTEPAGHAEELNKWELSSDSVKAFIESEVSFIESGPGVGPKDLYSRYTLWCTVSGRYRLSRTNFDSRVSRLLPQAVDNKFPIMLKSAG